MGKKKKKKVFDKGIWLRLKECLSVWVVAFNLGCLNNVFLEHIQIKF